MRCCVWCGSDKMRSYRQIKFSTFLYILSRCSSTQSLLLFFVLWPILFITFAFFLSLKSEEGDSGTAKIFNLFCHGIRDDSRSLNLLVSCAFASFNRLPAQTNITHISSSCSRSSTHKNAIIFRVSSDNFLSWEPRLTATRSEARAWISEIFHTERERSQGLVVRRFLRAHSKSLQS